MAGNGGIIGKLNRSTLTAAKGVWGINELHVARQGTVWPIGAPAFVGATGANADAVETITVPHPAGIAAGDRQILVACYRSVDGAPTLNTSGWTQERTWSPTGDGGSIGGTIWSRPYQAGDAAPEFAAKTWNSFVLGAWRNVTSIETTSGASNGNTNTPQAPSLTTSSTNARILVWVGQGGRIDTNSGQNITVPSGFTERHQTADSHASIQSIADQVWTATGATGVQAGSFNTSGYRGGGCMIMLVG